MREPQSREHPSTPGMWRSLDEWAETEEFQQWIHREFPERASEWLADQPSRREFLRVMGASLAFAGFTGCVNSREEKIVPPVETPEHPPGMPPLQFSTAMPMTGGGLGLLVDSRDGRPIKIEGNPDHPASHGATGTFAQAALLDLYDPDRSTVVKHQGRISSWDEFATQIKPQLDAHRSQEGEGLRILSPPILSPTLARQRRQLLEAMPKARWHTYEPVHNEQAIQGAKLAFGEAVTPRYQIDEADVILAIDDDFLGTGAGKLAYARQFAKRRRVETAESASEMNRLYAVESTPTLTGASADHRWSLKPREIQQFLIELAKRLGLADDGKSAFNVPSLSEADWQALISDLRDESKQPLVACGIWQPPEVHALVHAINDHLGAIGTTVVFSKDSETNPQSEDGQTESLKAAVNAMNAGEVETLLILDANPVFDSPGDIDFASALDNVTLAIHSGQNADETANRCEWHLPSPHFLESWGDTRAFDGTASLIQPLIDPLHNSVSPYVLMNLLFEESEKTAQETVRETWRQQDDDSETEADWNESLKIGVIAETSSASYRPELAEEFQQDPLKPLADRQSGASADEKATVIFRPHPTLWDGRFANNGWLQELPQPFTKLTWNNAALISRQTAQVHGLNDGDHVELTHQENTVTIPVVIVPGQADNVITLHLGAGRKQAGRVGDGVGVNVYPFRLSEHPWILDAVNVSPTGERTTLAATQNHFLMDGRDLVRTGSRDEYLAHPEHPPFMESHDGHGTGHDSSLYDREDSEFLTGDSQWGMSINQSACIGCNACVVACQAENNIPVVGPDEVKRGREMHWLRIDSYFSGEPENPKMYHQPVACMHCEHAPCEVVCPVAATTHSDEGLNEMTYNRCIGTRYCSNNCPYKVRRFNFFDYHEETREQPVLQLLQNPEVTVRSRGVMEKCTYCVQRINSARIDAKMDGREMQDGDVVTACQAVCPTEAISFGDISDPKSAVSQQKSTPLSYGLLEELNTRPRTTYLAAVRNPHPDLQPEQSS